MMYAAVTKIIEFFLITCRTTFCPPSAETRLGMNSTSCCKSHTKIFSHAVSIEVHSCDRVYGDGVWARTILSIMSLTCSVGFKSSDLDGQTIRWKSLECFSNQSRINLERCHPWNFHRFGCMKRMNGCKWRLNMNVMLMIKYSSTVM